MQVNTCIRELVALADASMRGVSQDLGRSSEYVRTVSAPTRSPALATVCDVADVLGYRLAVLDGAGRVVGTIEAPRSAAAREGGSQEG